MDLRQDSNIPCAFRACLEELGHQGGARAGLCPWWKPTEGESPERVRVREEEPASRETPWRQHSQETQEREESQDPGRKS